jgi:3-hydroxypropanoate dehydrogenase
MTRILDDRSLDSVFRAARRCRAWLDTPVSDAIIEAVWELAKLPPLCRGDYPARIVFAKSPAAKERILPALAPDDAAATLAAPICAVIAYDPRVADGWRDGTLQGAYVILAARALGLDCVPLAPLDLARLDAAFFPDASAKSSFVCNLGYGDPLQASERPVAPPFETACRFA